MFRNYARILTFGFSLLAGAPNAALADWAYTPGAGPSKFLSYNSATSPAGTSNCAASNVDCMAYIPVGVDGAAWFTAAKPAIVAGGGTAGTPGSAVMAVQGVPSGTAIPAALNTTPTIANGNGVVPTQGGTALSTTNGGFYNILQGNATLGAGNGIFANILQGNAVLSATNAIFGKLTDGTTVAAVKAASTAVATTDTALSVQINPNTPAVAMKIAAAQVASGAYASGAFAAGSLASGAGVDGWDLTQGAKADAVCTVPTSVTACSVIAILKGIANAIAPGSGGTSSTFSSAFPSAGTAMGASDGTNMKPILVDANGNVKVVGTGLADASTSSGQTFSKVGANALAGLASYTTAQTNPLTMNLSGQLRTVNPSYPDGAVPITASATGTTAATTATLAASASLKTYLCWFSIRANATAAATANSTVTGPVTGTLNFTQWTAPLASGLGLTEMIFNPCIPSSAINTAVAVISAAPGSGGVVSVSAGGYQAL